MANDFSANLTRFFDVKLDAEAAALPVREEDYRSWSYSNVLSCYLTMYVHNTARVLHVVLGTCSHIVQ